MNTLLGPHFSALWEPTLVFLNINHTSHNASEVHWVVHRHERKQSSIRVPLNSWLVWKLFHWFNRSAHIAVKCIVVGLGRCPARVLASIWSSSEFILKPCSRPTNSLLALDAFYRAMSWSASRRGSKLMEIIPKNTIALLHSYPHFPDPPPPFQECLSIDLASLKLSDQNPNVGFPPRHSHMPAWSRQEKCPLALESTIFLMD